MASAHMIFDRHLLALRRARAAQRVERVLPVLEDAADRLLDRLDDITLRFRHALDLGGRGVVAPRLRQRGVEHVVSLDLAPAMARIAGGHPVAGDEEWLPFAPGSFDLIVANLSLHWVNDLPGALIQLRQALRPDGLLLASLPALGTLQNLREALATAEHEQRGGVSPRVSPFPEISDGAALLQRAGFALPVADAETMTLAYRSPIGLLRDLQAAGESNAVLARAPGVPPRALLPATLAQMQDEQGQISVTLRLLTLTGWAPAPTQQQPARPGSATVRLADALGAEEHKLGETPPGRLPH
ncbi:methyltransferase domain-containing protein [Roseomonas elaeocarpi]|uniref:Methyltransferase domain-containing protein n=1 Tax=Roseomonas elaeocarpi TaxID=907779 RepID=A0ABV6JUR8_9PROT